MADSNKSEASGKLKTTRKIKPKASGSPGPSPSPRTSPQRNNPFASLPGLGKRTRTGSSSSTTSGAGRTERQRTSSPNPRPTTQHGRKTSSNSLGAALEGGTLPKHSSKGPSMRGGSGTPSPQYGSPLHRAMASGSGTIPTGGRQPNLPSGDNDRMLQHDNARNANLQERDAERRGRAGTFSPPPLELSNTFDQNASGNCSIGQAGPPPDGNPYGNRSQQPPPPPPPGSTS